MTVELILFSAFCNSFFYVYFVFQLIKIKWEGLSFQNKLKFTPCSRGSSKFLQNLVRGCLSYNVITWICWQRWIPKSSSNFFLLAFTLHSLLISSVSQMLDRTCLSCVNQSLVRNASHVLDRTENALVMYPLMSETWWSMFLFKKYALK